MKSKNIQKVIDNFETVLPAAMTFKKHLNMKEMDVDTENLDNSNHVCNTTMCHGGWYAAATWTNTHRGAKPTDYEQGAAKMATHLGFRKGMDDYDTMDELSSWAHNHPEIWGNKNGEKMFSAPSAFKSPSRPKGAKTLADIVQHWKEVKERVEKLEKSK